MKNVAFWVWTVTAAVFLLAEIFTAGFFLFPFGIGAAVAALLALFGVAKWAQWTAFLGVSILMTIIARRFAEKSVRSAASTGIDRLLGARGIVIEAIENARGEGRVRIRHEEWRAWADGEGTIPASAEVDVIRIEGNHLVVRRVAG